MIYKAKKTNVVNAIEVLKRGKIIIYPTDTLYGFGVDATNSIAITKINKLKNRNQPLSIIVDSIQMLKRYASVNSSEIQFLENYFPGAFTFLLKKKNSNLSNMVTLNSNKIGIRIPENNFILDVVKTFNKPIITTSINLHGENSVNDLETIKQNFHKIDIFEGRTKAASIGSTIVDLTTNQPKIIRKGDGNLIYENLS
tara:strand:- start:749 stop:1342 length:594 start_codon:yes stop_codon:yes gene_type:complete